MESLQLGLCPLLVRARAAGSQPVPPAWHHVPCHPVPSGLRFPRDVGWSSTSQHPHLHYPRTCSRGGEGDKGRVAVPAIPQAPGCLAVPAAAPRSVPRPGRREGRRVPRRRGGRTRTQLPPGSAGEGQPQAERGLRAPRCQRGARDSRAGSPSAGERLEQEVYGAALSDANGLKPIKRDGFM